MEKEKNKRSPNFTDREKELLITLVKKYFQIIENKKTNAVFNKQKIECWEKLAWEYNAIQTSGLRTGIKLKSAYEQMKKIAKQHKAQDKVELVKTGGGTFKPILTDLDEKVLGVIEENYFFIQNELDSNSDLPKIPTPSTSKGLDDSASNFENILIVYENIENSNNENPHEHHINEITNDNIVNEIILGGQEEPLLKKRKICTKSQQQELLPPDTENIEPERTGIENKTKKRPQWKTNVSINTARYEILKKKISILEIIAETEKENLKCKKIETETKEIIKQRELLELERKQTEYT